MTAMTRLSRKRIALLQSLLLTVFLICQSMAQAGALRTLASASQEMPVAAPSCHVENAEASTPAQDDHCSADCQHLVKTSESSSQHLSGVDKGPLALILVLPALHNDAGSPIRLSALPLHDPPPSASIAVRFQRFRE